MTDAQDTPDVVAVERHGTVAVVRFASGGRANPLSVRAMQALLDTALALERDPHLCAVVLAGTADTFSYGFDLRDAGKVRALPLAERREAQSLGPRLCAAWERIEALTVAAVEGWCVGGGVALACALDLRVAGASATFYVPEIERGMNMSWGSVPRIVNLVGPAKAKRLVMLAERVDARRAEDWGLVDAVADDGGAVARALQYAERAAAMPPVQLRMCKAGINAYANALAPAAAALDRDQYLLAQLSGDFAEGVEAFLQKRPPRYTGR
jgi:enoyl-CoA hydratase/carnithine racemase